MPELLIVDDDKGLRRWAERVVQDHGYTHDSAADASAAHEKLRGGTYQLVLLDVNMPGESGIELLADIRREYPETAVLIVTGVDSTKLAMTAIELGAYGYLVKPIGAGELLINVATALHRWRADAENLRLVERLSATVKEHGQTIEDALQELELSQTEVWVSQAETIFRLARMVEFRDEDTGHHLHRMSSYCELIAREVGFPAERREIVRLASQLHDVGKIAVPDSILLKRGKLSSEEFEIMKGHAETGYEMLAGSRARVVQLGASIARTHHERYDGSGYPRGLAGEDIPQEGRMAAVADVFDALTSDRIYRAALPAKSAIQMMREERGQHFDPELLDIFVGAQSDVDAIRHAFAD